jgi:hypothetical protein
MLVIFRADNLYVAGSLVFPTFSIVALSLRLAAWPTESPTIA